MANLIKSLLDELGLTVFRYICVCVCVCVGGGGGGGAEIIR